MDRHDETTALDRTGYGVDDARQQAREGNWERPADRALLEAFGQDGPEYCPLVAGRLGLHLKYAERRCNELESRGYLRQRDGRSYELTECGVTRLDETEGGASE
jgi:hypothetical protein